MQRFYVKTGYHYWIVVDRAAGKNVGSFSARRRGDNAARKAARDYCEQMNRAHGCNATDLEGAGRKGV